MIYTNIVMCQHVTSVEKSKNKVTFDAFSIFINKSIF